MYLYCRLIGPTFRYSSSLPIIHSCFYAGGKQKLFLKNILLYLLISIISAGNPAVIASTPNHFIIPTAGSRPTLIAFVSGSPAPTRNNITWYFNNGTLPPDTLFNGDKSELLLPANTPREYSGIYTIQVTTSNGTASDNFAVTVTSESMVHVIFYTEHIFIEIILSGSNATNYGCMSQLSYIV